MGLIYDKPLSDAQWAVLKAMGEGWSLSHSYPDSGHVLKLSQASKFVHPKTVDALLVRRLVELPKSMDPRDRRPRVYQLTTIGRIAVKERI